jgi:hypothetical protein
MIDLLTDRLEDVSSDSTYLPSVHAAAAKGLAVLNKYYAKTDQSVMYRCAMSKFKCLLAVLFIAHLSSSSVLHPKYKLSYFRLKKWPEEWIDTARTVLREQWVLYYKPSNDLETNTSSSQSSSLVCFESCTLV